LMVHQSLRKLAHLAQVPEDVVTAEQYQAPNFYIKKSASVGIQAIDPDRVLEADFLRWLLLMGESHPHFVELSLINLSPDLLHVPCCQKIYRTYIDCYHHQKQKDLLSLAIDIDDEEAQELLSEILQKKVNRDRAEEHLMETLKRILDRNWMEERERIKMKIQSGQCTDDEVLELAKNFDELKRNPPQIQQLEVHE